MSCNAVFWKKTFISTELYTATFIGPAFECSSNVFGWCPPVNLFLLDNAHLKVIHLFQFLPKTSIFCSNAPFCFSQFLLSLLPWGLLTVSQRNILPRIFELNYRNWPSSPKHSFVVSFTLLRRSKSLQTLQLFLLYPYGFCCLKQPL